MVDGHLDPVFGLSRELDFRVDVNGERLVEVELGRSTVVA
jgi:hypothetical protein